MTSRLVFASLFLAGTAAAQAPGDYSPDYATAPTQAPGEVAPAPVVVATPHNAEINPMANRFAIGLNFGGFSIAPEDAPEGNETEFRIAELAVRFRATRRLEFFIAFTGGRQVLEDDTDGDLAYDMVTLGARLRFMPDRRWNWFLLAGFGSTLIAPHDTPEALRDDLRRGHAMFGVGVERRFRHLAIEAELRGISVEERDEMDVVLDGRGDAMSSGELGGGQFTLGASYYF